MEKEITLRENCAKAGRAGRGQCKNRSVQMKAYWRQVKAGKIKHRGRGRSKPKQSEFSLKVDRPDGEKNGYECSCGHWTPFYEPQCDFCERDDMNNHLSKKESEGSA